MKKFIDWVFHKDTPMFVWICFIMVSLLAGTLLVFTVLEILKHFLGFPVTVFLMIAIPCVVVYYAWVKHQSKLYHQQRDDNDYEI